MSLPFDIAKIYKLIYKLTLTNSIIKFIANYVKERLACTQCNGTLSKRKRINSRIKAQNTVLSPTLFSFNTSDIPLSLKDIQITTYADEITITAA